MSEDLQAIKYLNDTCINFLDRTKELYCTVTFTRKRAEILRDNIAEVNNALQRLEAIDNANPSEALNGLEFICKILNEKRIDVKWLFKNEYTTIKQALLKAQEQEAVVKALQGGIYVKDMPREDLIKQFGLKLSNIETEWYLSNEKICVNLKDYKKTWWLKEDKSE